MEKATQRFLQDLKLIIGKWCVDYFRWKNLELRQDILDKAREFAYEMDLSRSEAENKERFEKFLKKHTRPLIQKATRDKKDRGRLSILDRILMLDGENRRLMILHRIFGQSSRSISKILGGKVHHTTINNRLKRLRALHAIKEKPPSITAAQNLWPD